MKETNDVDRAIIYSISTRLPSKLMSALGAIITLEAIVPDIGKGTGTQLHQQLAIAVIVGFITDKYRVIENVTAKKSGRTIRLMKQHKLCVYQRSTKATTHQKIFSCKKLYTLIFF